MLDDIRNHDATPTPEESAWMHFDGMGTALRACTLAAVALVIGLGASVLVEDRQLGVDVAVFGPR
jgi:hypothetical protein